MNEIKCAVCGDKQKTEVLYDANFSPSKINPRIFSARRLPDRLHYRFVRCKNCGLIFSNPIFSTAKIKKLYKDSKFTYPLEAKYLKKTYGKLLLQILPKTNRKKIKLLDIGCGNGFFLEEALSLGVNDVYGIEPSIDSIKKALPEIGKNIKNDILKPEIYKNNTFDIICFFHTLDHIVDPNEFLKVVYGLLKKNGKIICVIHDTDGLSVRLFKEKSPIFDIEHIFLFNKKNIAKLLVKNKFRNIKSKGLVNTYPLIYWLSLLNINSKIKKVLISLMVKTRLAYLPVSVNAGNMYVISEK